MKIIVQVYIIKVAKFSLSEDRVLHKGARVTTHLRIHDHKKVKYLGLAISTLGVNS